MKILSVDKIREADAYTIAHEPIASIDLMERAAKACYDWIRKRVDRDRRVLYFCGPGNNGGDGLAIARMMAQYNFNGEVYVILPSGRASSDFRINFDRLKQLKTVEVNELKESDPLPVIKNEDVVVDALFGSGLNQPVDGFPARLIRHINASRALVVSVDIPSGLYADRHTDEKEGAVVHADYTLSFQLPRFAFMFAENDLRVGEWQILPIGLHEGFIRGADARDYLVSRSDVRERLRPRTKFSHKGQYGHALLVAGSYGKMGASVLASRACLRSGVGLLHAHSPGKGVPVMQTAVPEAMLTVDEHEEYFSKVPDLSLFTAIGAGPGIGFAPQTRNALKLLIQNTTVPLLFDADAITILGENKTWLSFLPPNSVLTPHPKEFERITRKAADDFDRNRLQREFCRKHGVYVVLKGAHTSICGPDGVCWYNTTGNPGMATGGSGDVLTGLILGLLAQKYPPLDASLIGVYLHGLAGDMAAKKLGMDALIAGDLVDHIGKAFKKLH